MYYHDSILAGSQVYFTDVFGVSLQMGVYYQNTTGVPGSTKLYDATDHATGDKGIFISTQGNKPFCEYLVFFLKIAILMILFYVYGI